MFGTLLPWAYVLRSDGAGVAEVGAGNRWLVRPESFHSTANGSAAHASTHMLVVDLVSMCGWMWQWKVACIHAYMHRRASCAIMIQSIQATRCMHLGGPGPTVGRDLSYRRGYPADQGGRMGPLAEQLNIKERSEEGLTARASVSSGSWVVGVLVHGPTRPGADPRKSVREAQHDGGRG